MADLLPPANQTPAQKILAQFDTDMENALFNLRTKRNGLHRQFTGRSPGPVAVFAEAGATGLQKLQIDQLTVNYLTAVYKIQGYTDEQISEALPGIPEGQTYTPVMDSSTPPQPTGVVAVTVAAPTPPSNGSGNITH